MPSSLCKMTVSTDGYSNQNQIILTVPRNRIVRCFLALRRLWNEKLFLERPCYADRRGVFMNGSRRATSYVTSDPGPWINVNLMVGWGMRSFSPSKPFRPSEVDEGHENTQGSPEGWLVIFVVSQHALAVNSLCTVRCLASMFRYSIWRNVWVQVELNSLNIVCDDVLIQYTPKQLHTTVTQVNCTSIVPRPVIPSVVITVPSRLICNEPAKFWLLSLNLHNWPLRSTVHLRNWR